jgi:DNA-directed RNA polymerase specialized sigma24 family protein
VIARIWTGAVRREDGDVYAEYMRKTGVAGYVQTPGNRGIWMLRRDVDERTEFVMFTLWESLDAVKAFAGKDYETAVFYPEDERFLVERDLRASHFEVATYAVGADDRPERLHGDQVVLRPLRLANVELVTAIQSQPEVARAAVLLVDAQGFDYRAAAEVLGTPAGTVASRLNRARAVLRRALGKSTEGIARR